MRRSAPRGAPLALALAGCGGLGSARYPCDGEPDWPAGTPLYLRWGSDAPPLSSYNLVQGVRLVAAGGDDPVPLEAAGAGSEVVFCPLGDLTPGAIYRWDVDFDNRSGNQLGVPAHPEEGEWSFAAGASAAPAFAAGECAAWWDEQEDYFAELDCACGSGCAGDSGR